MPCRRTENSNLLVFGGSQGARVMSEIVPAAVGQLDASLGMRFNIVQQCRAEDLDAVRSRTTPGSGSPPKSLPFSSIFPRASPLRHLVVSRSGASTVAELSAIGRPAILVPLPHALDQDQFANAGVIEAAGGAIRIEQRDFSAERLAREITALSNDPARLAKMAQAAKSAARPMPPKGWPTW